MSHPEYAHIGAIEDRLVEECAELIMAIQKGKRFGWLNYHPDRPGTTNLEDCQKEIQDVCAAMIEFEEILKLERSMSDVPNN